MTWTDQRIAVLKRMAAGGSTFSEVARALGEGCTRCMVAGKAKRLGVKFPVSSAKLSRAQPNTWAKLTPEAKQRRLEATTYRTPAHQKRLAVGS